MLLDLVLDEELDLRHCVERKGTGSLRRLDASHDESEPLALFKVDQVAVLVHKERLQRRHFLSFLQRLLLLLLLHLLLLVDGADDVLEVTDDGNQEGHDGHLQTNVVFHLLLQVLVVVLLVCDLPQIQQHRHLRVLDALLLLMKKKEKKSQIKEEKEKKKELRGWRRRTRKVPSRRARRGFSRASMIA